MTLCKDCRAEGLENNRPMATFKNDKPVPGPRCATHWRAFKKKRSADSHARGIGSRFGITPEEYQALYEAQGGVCYLCQRANGKTKRLAVDHDHSCTAGHPPDQGCKLCIRGLVCSVDNDILGHARDDYHFFIRGALYLTNPPARKVFGWPTGQ